MLRLIKREAETLLPKQILLQTLLIVAALVASITAYKSNGIALTIKLLPSTFAQVGISTTVPTPNSKRTTSTGIKQVWVPPTGPNCFMMGSTQQQVQNAYQQAQKDYGDSYDVKLEWFAIETPQHKTCLTQGYWLDQYDVTNADFDVFAKADGYTNDKYWSVNGLAWKKENKITGPDTMVTTCRVWPINYPIPPRDLNNLQRPYSNELQHPRVCVSWYEAEAYANWRTKNANDSIIYRLPTEAEWEYAARGSQSLIYPWGNIFDGTLLNYCDKSCHGNQENDDDGFGLTSPVGTYEKGKSWVNTYDMVGNVWQWTSDWYASDYYQTAPTNNPTGPTSGTYRVIRGGSWSDKQSGVRTALRNKAEPSIRSNNLGFRLVGIAGSQ